MPDTLVLTKSIGGRADVLPGAFVCSWTDGGRDAAWVHVGGELDLATAPQLTQPLRLPELQARLVVLDLRELTFIDSSGLHAIIDADRRIRRAGRRLVVLRGPANVDRLFTLTGSSDRLEIGDLDPGEPAVQVLMQLAAKELA